jgi:hypothetical protein
MRLSKRRQNSKDQFRYSFQYYIRLIACASGLQSTLLGTTVSVMKQLRFEQFKARPSSGLVHINTKLGAAILYFKSGLVPSETASVV